MLMTILRHDQQLTYLIIMISLCFPFSRREIMLTISRITRSHSAIYAAWTCGAYGPISIS